MTGAAALALFGLVAAGGARAGSLALYGSSTGGQVFLIDLQSGHGTLVGLVPPLFDGFTGATEIQCDPASPAAMPLCYAQYPDGAFAIQAFNLPTFTAVGGPVDDHFSFTGLEFVSGTLYGTAISIARGPSTLRTLDPASGTSTAIGATGVGPISGLAFDTTTSTMYGIDGGPGPANLYTINLGTGVATSVGNTGIQAGSLAFGPDGLLYAGGTGANAGFLYRIDPASGQSTVVGSTGFDSVTGLTLAPFFPPPSPVPVFSDAGLLLAVGALLMLAHRRLRTA